MTHPPSMSQSPSLRGSGRFEATPHCWRRQPIRVSIPFIAGQWSLRFTAIIGSMVNWMSQSPSLRGSGRFSLDPERARRLEHRLNPLHCGAVVASKPPAAWRRGKGGSLNPLHCGAVVASLRHTNRRPRSANVSIPFIAGQWSLRRYMSHITAVRLESQSPSLRGSGRFALF